MRRLKISNTNFRRKSNKRYHPPFAQLYREKLENKPENRIISALEKIFKLNKKYIASFYKEENEIIKNPLSLEQDKLVNRSITKAYLRHLPRYRRIQQFFQKNRLYIRRLYGEMRDRVYSLKFKKINKTDRKRRRTKMQKTLAFNATSFMPMNNMFPSVRQLRQLVKFGKVLVNGQVIKDYHSMTNQNDFFSLVSYHRPQELTYFTRYFSKIIWEKTKKKKELYGGFNHIIIDYIINKKNTKISQPFNLLFAKSHESNKKYKINCYINYLFWFQINKNFNFKKISKEDITSPAIASIWISKREWLKEYFKKK